MAMSLQADIDQYKVGFVEKVPTDIQDVMAQATQTLSESGIVEKAPKVGDKLKEFTLLNSSNEKVSLSELTAKGSVIVTFYRGGWCPYCNLELAAYQGLLPEIAAAGATLVAITPELPDESLSTVEKNALKFQVLTDVNAAYARELNLVFSLAEELRPIYLSFGIDIEKHNGTGQFGLPLAATFVIDQSATIVSAFVDADYTKRQEPSEVVKALKKAKT